MATNIEIPGHESPVVVGRGGFGVVYRMRQIALDREVAVKVLAETLDESGRRRFATECRTVGSLCGHPNIVTVHESGFTSEGLPYLSMEYLADGSLGDRLTRSGRMEWNDAVHVAIRLAGAVETAHRAGILHRDIKPDNVLVSPFGEPKLADFGIAGLAAGESTGAATMYASLSHAAPELLAGQRSSVASDVYALGSTLFALLAGRAAFARRDDEALVAVLSRIASEAPPDVLPGVPASVLDVVQRAMSKDPTGRYATAVAFGRALQRAQEEAGTGPTELTVGTTLKGAPAEPSTEVTAAAPVLNPPARPAAAPTPVATPAPTPTSTRRSPRWALPVTAAVIVVGLVAGGVGLAQVGPNDDGDDTAASPSSADMPSSGAGPGAESDDGSGPTDKGGNPVGSSEEEPTPASPPPPAGPCPETVAYGQLIGCELTSPGALVRHGFEGRAGEVLRIRRIDDELPVRVEVLRPDGAVECTRNTPELECELEVAGRYTMVIDGVFAERTGNYRLSFERITPLAGCESVTYDTVITGSVSSPGQLRCASFAGRAGDVFRMRNASGSDGLAMRIEVLRPDGTPVCQRQTPAFDCELDATGRHLLRLDPVFADETGSYATTFHRISPLAGCRPLAPGAEVTGTIDIPGEVVCLSLQAAAGSTYRVRRVPREVAKDLAPRIEVLAPDGTEVCDGTPELDCTFTATGVHILRTEAVFAERTGTFQIAVACVSGRCD